MEEVLDKIITAAAIPEMIDKESVLNLLIRINNRSIPNRRIKESYTSD